MDYKLINSDCLNVDLENVSLVYLDPPYAHKSEDNYYGVGNSRKEYLDFMRERLVKVKTWLAKDANIVLHIDWKNVHYLKIVSDDIFGENNFRNEISWCYSGPSVAKRWFPKKHDQILWYGIGDYTFNQQRIPYAKGLRVGGSTGWSEKKDTTEYLERGKLLEDWWCDIPALMRNESERTGYLTQKPLKLLTRIIDTFSKPGDMVVDPMCGSGTTLVAAVKSGRNTIGCDINEKAIEIAKTRLKEIQ